jgi:hypothetical protein
MKSSLVHNLEMLKINQQIILKVYYFKKKRKLQKYMELTLDLSK